MHGEVGRIARIGWSSEDVKDVREAGAALDAREEGGDEDCVEGEVG